MIKLIVKMQHLGGWFRVLEVKAKDLKEARKIRQELMLVYENDKGYVGIDIVDFIE